MKSTVNLIHEILALGDSWGWRHLRRSIYGTRLQASIFFQNPVVMKKKGVGVILHI